MRTHDKATRGYYIVTWVSKPYTVQENIILKGVEPPETDFTVELICDAVFWIRVRNAIDWYTLMDKEDSFRLTNVVKRIVSDKN